MALGAAAVGCSMGAASGFGLAEVSARGSATGCATGVAFSGRAASADSRAFGVASRFDLARRCRSEADGPDDAIDVSDIAAGFAARSTGAGLSRVCPRESSECGGFPWSRLSGLNISAKTPSQVASIRLDGSNR
jgi:hypothetical protein